MYLKVFDPEKNKYCLIEFNAFVGDLPQECAVCEIVTDFAREKLLEEKQKLIKGESIGFKCRKMLDKYAKKNENNIVTKKATKELNTVKNEIKKAISLINEGNEIEAVKVLVQSL